MAFSEHNTLSGTTAAAVTIGTAGVRMKGVEVTNPSASAAILYFTYTTSDNAATTAVAEADGTIDVLPGGSTFVPFGSGAYVDVFRVSVVGNGNTYSVRGIRA